jgi:hypothetical protein
MVQNLFEYDWSPDTRGQLRNFSINFFNQIWPLLSHFTPEKAHNLHTVNPDVQTFIKIILIWNNLLISLVQQISESLVWYLIEKNFFSLKPGEVLPHL